jgi:hypothetical protein
VPMPVLNRFCSESLFQDLIHSCRHECSKQALAESSALSSKVRAELGFKSPNELRTNDLSGHDEFGPTLLV